ncbi:hypothetical protein OPKNFCMD_2453 [Methylobacterium crusticola]|uniref:LysR substrate-binding domain-containing protein n=2 Tax=Methylobacterium crusticola TaxID=1697972 RepID=A0ABQ4QYB9_9HYPH|nr:hypothetical protein OPKNFCMD_2453 [Methylobacterium crusticola]
MIVPMSSERGTDLLTRLDELANRVSAHQASPHGVIHVHSRASVAEHFVIPGLPSFLAVYPDVRVNLWLTAAPRDLLGNNIDVAIRLGNLDEPQLAIREISSGDPRILFASPDYLNANPPIQSPEALRHHDCLGWPFDGRFEDGHAIWRFREGDQIQEVRVKGTVQINNTSLLIQLALKGLGVVLLPVRAIADHLAADRLRRILPDVEATPTTFDHQIYAVFQRSTLYSTQDVSLHRKSGASQSSSLVIIREQKRRSGRRQRTAGFRSSSRVRLEMVLRILQ